MGAETRIALAHRSIWRERSFLASSGGQAAAHLEHAAAAPRADGERLAASEHCLPHWWFVSRSRPLEAIVDSTVEEVGAAAEPAVLMAADALERVTGHAMPPGDGAFVAAAGVPVVQHLNAPVYLFDRSDAVEMVHSGALEGIGGVASTVLDKLAHVTRDELLEGRYEPTEEESRLRSQRADALEKEHGLQFRGFVAKQ